MCMQNIMFNTVIKIGIYWEHSQYNKHEYERAFFPAKTGEVNTICVRPLP